MWLKAVAHYRFNLSFHGLLNGFLWSLSLLPLNPYIHWKPSKHNIDRRVLVGVVFRDLLHIRWLLQLLSDRGTC